jgi:hypothetical protein
MPYVIRKVRNKNCFSVKNLKTNTVKSVCTTRQKAESQVRLLESFEKKKK